ncbi:MAG: OmpA family protein [Phycisphaerae bacterium]|nr:OmpA family protein [Phycisphaerae bacterium]
MSRKKTAPPQEEKGECAPLWIISFADMISLLMAFFVMLLTMSTTQSGKLCNEGEGVFEKTLYGFRRSIDGFGMPGMFGTAEEAIQFDSSKVYYPISDGTDRNVPRTIDASEENIRRDFRKLQQRTRTYEAQIRGRNPNFLVLPVTFAQGQSVLSESARGVLGRFLTNLKGFGSAEGLSLYVVGLAPDEPDLQQQWLLSAKRADAAAQFLQSGLPANALCRVFSWGAAAGGDWVKKDSPLSRQSQIAIATLRQND